MSVGVIITLVIVGILLLLVEFLIIPGVTVAGIVGSLLIIGGVVSGYYFHPVKTANFILLGTIVLLLLFFILAFKTKTWKKLGLKSEINSHATQDVAELFNVGDTGRAVSRLAPIGQIMINDTIVEARSMGGFIDPNTEIVIIRKEKNKLFIEPKSN
jgi:membrane-bound ClpP family serine protease